MVHLRSPKDPRAVRMKAFDDSRYKPFFSTAANFEEIAKGTWSRATEDASFRGGFRRYGAAKLFLIMMQHELQARLDTEGAPSKIRFVRVDREP
jgi:hypothetical protein